MMNHMYLHKKGFIVFLWKKVHILKESLNIREIFLREKMNGIQN